MLHRRAYAIRITREDATGPLLRCQGQNSIFAAEESVQFTLRGSYLCQLLQRMVRARFEVPAELPRTSAVLAATKPAAISTIPGPVKGEFALTQGDGLVPGPTVL